MICAIINGYKKLAVTCIVCTTLVSYILYVKIIITQKY